MNLNGSDVVCIVQARMRSARLPGKVLALIGAHPMIWHVVERCRVAIPRTVVAIPAGSADDPLAAYLATQDIPTFRWDGPEDDVLGRYVACLQQHRADYVVRVTADCPYIPPGYIHGVASLGVAAGADYVSNVWPRRKVPDGADVEMVRADRLVALAAMDVDPAHREHVTLGLREQVVRTEQAGAPSLPAAVADAMADWRWTVDTEADLAWARKVADAMDVRPPKPTIADWLTLFATRPDLCRTTDDAAR